MSSREAVLGRIRAALADVPADERPDDVPVPRAYRRSHTAPGEDTVALFAERVADYRANVTRTDQAGLRPPSPPRSPRAARRTWHCPAAFPPSCCRPATGSGTGNRWTSRP